MKITVITVCLNSADTIEKTIQSVAVQECHELEYIIIDGGSTDGTLDILDKYDAYIDKRISEPDKGIFDAMNKGIGMAEGDIIAILNSDDWYEEGALKMVITAFEQSDCDCVCCDNYVVGKDGKKIYYYGTDMSADDLYYRMIYFHSAVFCKRKYFRKCGNFDLSYKMAADYDWFLWVMEQKPELYLLHQPVFTFCYGGVSSVCEKECAREAREIAMKHLPPDKEDYQGKIDERFYEIIIRTADRKEVYSSLQELLSSQNENILWGAGVRGVQCVKWFREIGIKVHAVIDSDEKCWGQKIQGAVVYSPELLQGKACNLIITPENNISDIRNEIADKIKGNFCIYELRQLRGMLADRLEKRYQEVSE